MKTLLSLSAVLVLFITSCDDNKNEDMVKEVDKNGSIEVSLQTSHLDSINDIVKSHYTVWKKGVKVKEFDVNDTIPSLGKFKTEGEDDNGNTSNLIVPKDYEFYVTVK